MLEFMLAQLWSELVICFASVSLFVTGQDKRHWPDAFDIDQ